MANEEDLEGIDSEKDEKHRNVVKRGEQAAEVGKSKTYREWYENKKRGVRWRRR
jgi:hypothetical protein